MKANRRTAASETPPLGEMRSGVGKISKLQFVAISLSSLFFLLFYIPYFEEGFGAKASLDAPNEKTRVLGVAALGLYGELSINRVRQRWWCRITDLSGVKVKKGGDGPSDGAEMLYYPGKTPGISLYVGYLYRWYKKYLSRSEPTLFEVTYFSRLVGIILPVWLSSLLFLLFLLYICNYAYIAILSYWVFLLGTMTYAYGLTVASHSLANGCLIVGFLSILAPPRGGFARFISSAFGGAALGMAVAAEYSAVFSLLFIGIFALIYRPNLPDLISNKTRFVDKLSNYLYLRWHLAVTLIFSILPVLGVLWYHKAAFGSYWSTPYAHLVNEEFSAAFHRGFMGFQLPPDFQTLVSSLFSVSYGLFFWSPFLLLAVGGAIYFFWKYPGKRYYVWLFLAFWGWWLFYHSVQFNPRGGWSVGPRYIANLLPFTVAFAAIGAERVFIKWGYKGAFFLVFLAIWSILHNTVAAVLFPHIPTHSEIPQIEIFWTLVKNGLFPPSLPQLLLSASPKVSAALFLSALLLLFYSLTKPLKYRWLALFALLTLFAFLFTASLQIPLYDYNYIQERLEFFLQLFPPQFRL